MNQGKLGLLGLVFAAALLGPLGCGGGGSSSGGNNSLPQTSIPPTASFDSWTPNDASLLQYKVYTFNASATDPNIGGSITQFQWDMGDGTVTTTPVVLAGGKATTTYAYAYVTAGTPTLKVLAKNAAGLSSPAISKAFTVTASPSPLTVAFTSPTTATTLNPSIGGSVSITFSVSVVNTGTGTISASGILLDPGDPTATVLTPTSLGGGIWNIVATYPAAALTGTRTVTPTVKVSDSNGISSDLVTGVAITVRTVSSIDNAPVVDMVPTPKIIAGTNATYQNVAIDFKATATDPDGDTLSYTWTFGDTAGSGDVTATQDAAALSQTHTYAKAGVYPVTFTANDGRGAVGIKSITKNLNILANGAPTLTVTQAPTSPIYANVPITFAATVSDPDGDVPTLSWDFGDGSVVVTGPSPMVHSFAAAGSTTVKVTADDAKGGVTSWTNTLNVLLNRPPVSQVTTPVASLFQNKVYTFTATATDPDTADTITQFQWDFGDGTAIQTSATGTTTHTYASTFSGNAKVAVRSVDNHGSTGDFSPAVVFPVTATSLPVSNFLNPAGAATYNTETGAAGVTIAYIVSATNPNGTGFLPLSALTFSTGEAAATATILSSVANGDGTYTYQVQYKPTAAVGTRSVTPSLITTDLQGITGLLKSGGPVTINTQASNNPPVVTFTSASTPSAGTNASWQGVPFTFSGTATDADNDPMTYTVTFGDAGAVGDISTTPVATGGAITATHTYAAAGVYTAKLTVSDGRTNGIKSITLNMNVQANAAPVVTVANAPAGSSQYANVPVTFTATVTDANGDVPTLTWNFGDGSALVTGQNPVTHSFAAAGSTTVKAIADDGKGGVTTTNVALTILPNLPPVSSLTTPTASLFQNKAYTFTATATDPNAGDTISQYQWDFGDATAIQTTVAATTTHSYASTFTGNASVKVRATDNHGSTGDWSPAVVFPVTATSLTVSNFLNPAGAATYNTETGAAGVTIAYIVSATNPNGTGFLPLSALTFSTGEAAATATILSSVANGDGTYTYQVQYKPTAAVGTRNVTPSLIATDLQGITGLLKSGGPVTINTQASNNPPVVTFTSASTPSAGTNASWQGVPFTFSGTATDADNDPMTYTVTFGDTGAVGDISTTPVATGGAITATHTYAAAGVYTAKLTVSDGRTNGTKSITLNMNVQANAAPVVTVANAPAGTSQYANVPVTFTATVTDANGDVPTLTWNFGDGSALVVGQNPVTHSFAAAGSTTVKAIVDDGKGGVTTANVALTILPNLPPVSSLTTPTASLFQNKAYTFTATATDPNAGDTISQYQWDFGDATAIQTTVAATTTHSYASTFTGNASVKVRATDNHGSTGDWSPAVVFPVVATPLPAVTFLTPSATSLNLDLSPASVTQTFTFSATNPRAGTVPLTIHFDTNDALGTAGAVSYSAGTYSVTVTYTGAAAAGTRTSTPSAYATDSLGIVGLPANGPLMTLKTLGTNHAPSIVITNPASPTASAYTSKPISLGFTLNDPDNDPVSYTVAWGDGFTDPQATPTGDFVAGVAVSLNHTYADTFTGPATITVTATDNRSSNFQAVPQTRAFTVVFNTLPTAVINSPQDSGSAPTGYTPTTLPAGTVVVPLNGKLTFAGTSTPPASQDAVTSSWTFPGGTPSSASVDAPGDVIFTGTPGVITSNTVTYTVTDAFGRKAIQHKTVLVDGINTQLFNLSFQYRLKSDNNGTPTLATAVTSSNGLGALVQIYQDGQSNSYAVQNQAQLLGAQAVVDIPVRSDLPFYIKVPGFGNDTTSYLMRIPNAPTGAYADASLVATPTADSRFYFKNNAAPYDPTLQIVTAQGFATETSAAPQRRLDGYTDLVIGTTPLNERWLDRLSVPIPNVIPPAGDPSMPFQWIQSSNAAGPLFGIPAYQEFAEWPILILSQGTITLAETPADATSAAGSHTDLGFVLDYPTYTVTPPKSDTFAAFSLQATRVPGGVTDPYHMSPVWQTPYVNPSTPFAEFTDTYSDTHAGLNPTKVGAGQSTFLQNLINGNPGSTQLTGGIGSVPMPYDSNDPNRTPVAGVFGTRTYSGIRSVFSYSEYLWSTVWARPLVLNSARPSFGYATALNTFNWFRYSNPGAWPNMSGITPDNSAFNLTARGGGAFDGQAPVAVGGGVAPATGVGRFFWTAYTPSYTGDANQGIAISRTWLSDDSTKQIPTAFPLASPMGDATVAFGMMTPQDTIVDKRGRTATGALNGNNLGGYRVTWYNPTKDASGNPVPPDFWVVELSNGTTKTHFMLPANYPAAQSTSNLILTDARTYLPSGNIPTAGPNLTVAPFDQVGPGYCWFDIPVELRPTAGVTLMVFGVKSILKNHAVANARPLNRPDWMDAIKTATATIKVLSTNSTTLDLSYAHKIPFNYDWDIVVVNGPSTYVAP